MMSNKKTFHLSPSQQQLEEFQESGGGDLELYESVKQPSGFFLSWLWLAVILVAAVVLTVAVGLIVGLTAPECEKYYEMYKGWRLPDEVIPTYYNIELKPYLDPSDFDNVPDDFHFEGNVRITIRCEKNTRAIYLHHRKLTIAEDTIKLTSADGSSSVPQYETHLYNDETEIYQIILDDYLQTGKEYELYMEFNGPLTKSPLNGIYLSSYIDPDTGEEKWQVASQMESTNARKAFPCFDEPKYSTKFKTAVWHKKIHSAVYCTEIIDYEDHGDWIKQYYDETPKMPTYLNAFLISDFLPKKTTSSRGTDITAYAQPTRINETDYSLVATKGTIDFFEDHFGIAYNRDISKSDLAALPDFGAGAMENWGLILYREQYMLYNQKVSSARDKKNIATIVAHEVAHQWFGNLVTCEWWSHIWLNEGFATYGEFLGGHAIEPTWKLWEQYILDDYQYSMRIDSVSTSRPIVVPDETVNTPAEASAMFSQISYAKGGCINRMTELIIGSETYTRGLTKFLRRHEYGTARTDDLWAALNEQAAEENIVDSMLGGKDVKTIMDTWVLQNGFPLVSFERNYSANTATAKQRQFLRDQTSMKSASNLYAVPLTFTRADQDWDEPTRIWMHKEQEITVSEDYMPSDSDWVVVNPNAEMFYRIMYDEENFNLILTQLKNNPKVIDVRSRAMLIDDYFTLASATLVDQVTAMRTTEYLNKEDEYIPWKTALNSLGYIELMFSGKGAFGLYQSFMRKQIDLLYHTYGWGVTPDDSEQLQIYLKIAATEAACKAEVRNCIEESLKEFNEWMESETDNPISVNYRETVYCTAINAGDAEEWEFAWKMYKDEDWASERYRLLRGMGCSSEPWIINRYLGYAMSDDYVVQHEAYRVLVYTAYNYLGRQLVWEFLRANYDAVKDRINNSNRLRDVVNAVTNAFNTQFDLEEVQYFRSIIGTQDASMWDAVEENIRANIDYMEKNEEELTDWLEQVDSGTRSIFG